MRSARLARLEALETRNPRMIVAKLPSDGDLAALLFANGIELRPADMLVRLDRPHGCGSDFARVMEGR